MGGENLELVVFGTSMFGDEIDYDSEPISVDVLK
jgi:hypothetical protein